MNTLQYIAATPIAAEGTEFSPAQREVLAQINQKVAGASSLEAVMDFLFDATRAIFPCDRIGLAFVEEGGRRVTSHWVRALYEPIRLKKGYGEDLHGSSLEQILQSGQVRIIHDLEQYSREHPQSHSSKLLVDEGVRSSMTCPLYVEGRVVGLLFRSSRRAHDYDERQVRLHLTVAERLSQAVEKAYRIEQLAAANQAYMEVLGFVAHELKSPLASLVMDAQLLTDGYLGPMPAEQRDKVERMIRKAKYLLNLIGEYLDLARLEGGQMRLNPQTNIKLLADVIAPAAEIVQAQAQDKAMRVLLPGTDAEQTVQGDLELLRIVMVNLLSNAVKYGRQGGQIKVELERRDGQAGASVWNEGPGFPASEQGRLFRRFSRLQTPELLQQKGTGVGLYTCWRIINLHQGRMYAQSEPGRWARFGFEFPQPLPTTVPA